MEENYVLITRNEYQHLIERALKLEYIEKAVNKDSGTYEFMDRRTAEKIKFILGKEKEDESV